MCGGKRTPPAKKSVADSLRRATPFGIRRAVLDDSKQWENTENYTCRRTSGDFQSRDGSSDGHIPYGLDSYRGDRMLELTPGGGNIVSMRRRERSVSIPWIMGGSRMQRAGNRRVSPIIQERMGDRPSEADSDVFGGIWGIRRAFRGVRKIRTFQAEKKN